MQALLEYVLIGDKANDTALAIDHGEFLDLVLLQHLARIVPVGVVDREGYEMLRCHDVPYGHAHVVLETHVAVGYDSHEMVLGIGHWNASDMVVAHEPEGIAHRLVLVDRHGVVDHSVLRTLHLAHLGGLRLDAHVLVDDAYASLPCKGYGHGRFGYCVHSGGHDRDVEGDVPRKAAAEVHLLRKNFRIRRDEEHVVEGKAFKGDSFFYK